MYEEGSVILVYSEGQWKERIYMAPFRGGVITRRKGRVQNRGGGSATYLYHFHKPVPAGFIPEKGQVIMVRDTAKEEWVPEVFFCLLEGHEYPYETMNCTWRFARPLSKEEKGC